MSTDSGVRIVSAPQSGIRLLAFDDIPRRPLLTEGTGLVRFLL